VSNGGLPKMSASSGRASCSAGHSWKAFRVVTPKWDHDRGRRIVVEATTYTPEDCPACGQQPTAFREQPRRG